MQACFSGNTWHWNLKCHLWTVSYERKVFEDVCKRSFDQTIPKIDFLLLILIPEGLLIIFPALMANSTVLIQHSYEIKKSIFSKGKTLTVY